MKYLITATAVVLASASTAFASVALGGDAELFITGNASIEHNSNIFLGSSAKSDTILSFAPGILIPFGQNSATKGQLSLSEEFQIFSSQDDLNDELAHLDFMTKFDDGKAKLDVNASYNQINQANRGTAGSGTIARRDVSHAGLIGEFSATAKTSVSAGVVYDDTAYKLAGYTDIKTFDIPLKGYYEYSPQVDLSAGLRYRKNTLGTGGVDSEEYFYSVGARGELLPKLNGEFSIGYNNRTPDVGSDDSGLGLESTFTYLATEKTTAVFGLNSSFGYSATGSSQDVMGFNGGLRIAAQEGMTIDGSISYSTYDYSVGTRKDDFWDVRVGASYLVNGYVTVNGSISHGKNESNVAAFSFDVTKFNIGATLRY